MTLRRYSLIAALCLGLGAGCGTMRSEVKGFHAAPPAAPGPVVNKPAAVTQNDVLIRPGLSLSVVVLVAGSKEIEETTKRVAADGTISVPLVGQVRVAGLGLSRLRTGLQALYTKYFVNPQVMVEFAREDGPNAVSPWGYVTVLGRVKKPGRVAIPATRDLTVSGAIQQAGGFDTSARDTAIRVSRRNGNGLVETRDVNLRTVGSAGQLEEDVVLEEDDVVFVFERRL